VHGEGVVRLRSIGLFLILMGSYSYAPLGWGCLEGFGEDAPRQPSSPRCLERREASQSLMGPEEVVHGLEDGEGPVSGLEGFEAAECADPAPEGAVQPLQEVVAHRDRPTIVADQGSLELGDDVSGSGDGLLYGRRVGRGPVGDYDIRRESRLLPGLPQHPRRSLLVFPPGQLQGDYVPVFILHGVDVALPAPELDVEFIEMPYPGVLGPVRALEGLEAVAEPLDPEEDGGRGDGVAEAGHELRGLTAAETVAELEAEGEGHLLRRVLHAGEEGPAPLVELPAAPLTQVLLDPASRAIPDDSSVATVDAIQTADPTMSDGNN